jgi:hypothetical protein
MAMVLVHKNPDYGAMTTHQYRVVVKHAGACLEDTHQQMTSLGEVMLTNSAVDAGAGFVGGVVGSKAEVAALGARAVPHFALAIGAFNGLAVGVQGAANGAKIKSGAVANYVGNCVNGDIHDSLTAVGMAGMHVYYSGVRTKNSSKELPAYVKRVSGVSLPPGMSRASPYEPDPDVPE